MSYIVSTYYQVSMISYHDIKVWLYSENIYDFRILCNISCVIYYIQITDGTVISKSQTGLIQPPNPDYFRAFTYILYHTSWSLQGPEHCHIDFCKRLASCTNNKNAFLCILRCHVRAGHLQPSCSI